MTSIKKSLSALNRVSVDEYIQQKKFPIVVILDDIRSAQNVGSIFRTCDAFNVQLVILCGYTPQPPHRDVLKTAIGATQSVAWQYASSVVDSIIMLKDAGYKIYAVEQANGAINLETYHHSMHSSMLCAFILGNEVDGVSEGAMALADAFVEIPQYGTKHSLNVSVCAGIVLWEAAKIYMPDIKNSSE